MNHWAIQSALPRGPVGQGAFSRIYGAHRPGFDRLHQGFNHQGFTRSNPAFNHQGFTRPNPGFNHQGFSRSNLGFNRRGPMAFAHGGFPRRPLPGQPGFTGVPPVGETRFRSAEMVFHVNPNVSPQAVEAAARRLGLSTVDSENLSLTGGTLVHFHVHNGRPVPDVIRELEAEKLGIAQPNYVFTLQQSTNLAALTTQGPPSQYVVGKLRLPEVHRIAIGGNVLVAVIDSEIDARHPDIAGAVVGEFNALGKQESPHAHGTGMAGAIAAHRVLMGVAPGAHILAIHAFSPETTAAEATSDHILRGIEWAIKKGARVINMSFAGPDDPLLHVALEKAREKGVILIAAAGNGGPESPPLYPGADPNVIAVTATDEHDAIFAQANQGPYVAIAAPGVNVLEPAPSGGYQIVTGTSVAAAHVSGVAALLLERNPNISVDALRNILQSTAKHVAPK
ncbi:MAG: S8 family serine peptidase, partial [Bradyrhizobiaceae bacterium]|nr:S8 family serine peptidase [Bradyrhizobiaceae bacterium]